jgi:hypothetical protein
MYTLLQAGTDHYEEYYVLLGMLSGEGTPSDPNLLLFLLIA